MNRIKKGLNSLSNLGLVLYGAAAALAYIPIADSSYYTEYGVSNFIRFTGLGLTLSDHIFILALVFLLPRYIPLKSVNTSIAEIFLLLTPLAFSLTSSIYLSDSIARLIRLTVYLLVPLIVLRTKTDIRIFSLGYITLLVPHLMAIASQRVAGVLPIGLTLNPNLIGSYALTVIIIWTYAWLMPLSRYITQEKKILYTLPLVLALILIAITTSRGSIAGLAIFLVVFYITEVRNTLRSIKTLVPKYILALVPVLLVVVIGLGAGPRFAHLIHAHALSEPGIVNKLDSFSSGRITSFSLHLDRISRDKKWYKGYGLANYVVSTGKVPPHTIYLYMVAELGLLSVIYILGLALLTKRKPLLLLPLAIIGLVSYLTYAAEGTFITFTLLGLALNKEEITFVK